jgi:hypothetical protein
MVIRNPEMKKSSILLPLLFLTFFKVNSSPLPKSEMVFKNKNKEFSKATSSFGMMRMNMYAVNANGTSFLVDGTLTQYDDDFSNSVDGMDARKLTNPGENIGMIRDNKTLIIESRQTITLADTIFFKMWGMQKRSYQMQFIGTNLNHPGLQAFLEDTYLKSSTSINLNDTTKVNFAVNNDTASSSMYRFRLVFNTVTMVALPFVFTNVNGYWKNNHTILEWETINESNLNKYIIEKSSDRKGFFDHVPVNAQSNTAGLYQWIDENPVAGNNYYRIGNVDKDGKIAYSKVISVYVEKSNQSMTVYPNPATSDNFNLQLNNKEPGLYEVQLINSFGQILLTKSFNYIGGTGKHTINPGSSIPKGIYQLQVRTPDGGKKSLSVVFLGN